MLLSELPNVLLSKWKTIDRYIVFLLASDNYSKLRNFLELVRSLLSLSGTAVLQYTGYFSSSDRSEPQLDNHPTTPSPPGLYQH